MFNKITFLLILITFATYAASGYLQNEDFKTEAELITAGGSKSQLLNDTKVYVTGNGINKTLDDAIIDGDIGAGGGDAGINFIVDSSFEKETFAPTDDLTTGTATYPLFTTNDKLYSEFNTKYYQIAHTGLSAANYSVNYSQARTGLDGKQGLFSIWAKVNAELDLCIELDASGICESTVSLIADDTWRKYEIPFVFGASSVEFNFFNASLTGNITLQLDKAYIGVIPDGYIQDVGQASFVGDVYFNSTNCLWLMSSGTTWQSFPVDSDCTYSTRGNVLEPDTKIPAIKIPNARTDGYYQVKFNGTAGVTSASATDDRCDFNLSDTGSQTTYGGYAHTEVRSTAGDSRFFNELTGQFRFTSSGDKQIEVLVRPTFTGDNCGIFANDANFGGAISVHFFPDDNSTIVSQNTELTAQTANEFSATISDTGVVSNENYDWIDGNCTYASNIYTCDFNNTYANKLNCTITPTFNDRRARVGASTGSQLNYITEDEITDNFASSGVNLICSKNGTDVNKSATIIGKFEQINSSELCQIDAYMSSVETITKLTEDIPFHTELKDNCNIFNNNGNSGSNSNDSINPTRDGYWSITGYMQAGTAVNRLGIYKDGTEVKGCGVNEGNINTLAFACIVELQAGSVYTFRVSSSDFTTLASSVFSRFTATELPDTESIIKNLSQEKTKCQTKYLSSNFSPTTTTSNSSTNFSNLTVGKKYKACVQLRGTGTFAGLDVMGAFFDNNSATVLGRVNFTKTISSELFAVRGCTHVFTATDPSLFMKYDIVESGNFYNGGTDANTTYVELCELPSTYVETNQW